MWAHYADRNRGACLVFNKRKSAKSTDFLNVNYTKNRQFFKGKPPECISTLIGKNHSELIRLCATKELDWAYEEETRLLLNLNGSTTNEKNSHFWEWDETLELVNVYVGADPEVCVKSVELACKDSKIRVLQKRGAFTDFRVVEQENTNLWKKCPKMTAAKAIIEHLNLAPHPEGGWYRQTWLAEGEGRPSGSAIYYLLEAGQRSHWHRIDATEIWHFHAGAPLVLTTAAVDAGPVVETILGPDILAGQQAQMIVPIQHWQAAHSMGDYTLVSCTVSPAFHFEGFHMAKAGWVPGFQA
ncbi:MAG: cupin domain-containing protein [Rhodobacteraceae bacterium]|nr:cupin domain-containing protein [Paracoccaceae bacterium]